MTACLSSYCIPEATCLQQTALAARSVSMFPQVIKDITRRMGNGMADYIDMDEVLTIPQYDLYCHYVAGLCGIGMCKVCLGLLASHLETRSPTFASSMHTQTTFLILNKMHFFFNVYALKAARVFATPFNM